MTWDGNGYTYSKRDLVDAAKEYFASPVTWEEGSREFDSYDWTFWRLAHELEASIPQPAIEHVEYEHITTFIVPGQPKSKERPRHGRGRTYTPAATVAAETRVIEAFDLACPLWEPTIEHCQLTVDIHYTGKARGDGDNVYKLAADALNGVAYVDDKQIRSGRYNTHENAGNRAGLVITLAIRKEP